MIGCGSRQRYDDDWNPPRAQLGGRHRASAGQSEICSAVSLRDGSNVRAHFHLCTLIAGELVVVTLASRPNDLEIGRQSFLDPFRDHFVHGLRSLTAAIDEQN